MISIIVLICAGADCQAYENAMPAGTTLSVCTEEAPAILARLELPDGVMVAAWDCVDTGEPV